MKHFINPELGAPNALVIPVDEDAGRDLLPIADMAAPDTDFEVVEPNWKSDIRWISANSPEAFHRFEQAFQRTNAATHVAQYLDLEREVRLYAGYLVVRSQCSEPDFHIDWDRTNNEAFTLVTPLTANSEGFGMLYRRMDGSIGDYQYKLGEAIIFGDHFVHSTKPGQSEQPVVLLTFNFGTDKMAHWDSILRTAGYQSKMIRRPDGQFVDLSP
jgi:hypothetical protein